jgi:hypothetical protein
VTGSSRNSFDDENFGALSKIGVDAVMDPVAAAMFAADANVTAAVLVLRLVAWAFTLAVIPVATVTVHSVLAGRVAVPTVSVNVAAANPVFDPAAANVVEPQLCEVVMPDGVLTIKNVGKTSATLSVVTSNGAFNLNVYEIDVGRSVYGSEISSLLTEKAVTTV